MATASPPDAGQRILLGLIGAGIQGSRTPAMHEREGDKQGLRVLYQKLDPKPLGLTPDALPDVLVAAERMEFTGLNVTCPCKQAVIPLLHGLSDDAQALRAVNTVVLQDGQRPRRTCPRRWPRRTGSSTRRGSAR